MLFFVTQENEFGPTFLENLRKIVGMDFPFVYMAKRLRYFLWCLDRVCIVSLLSCSHDQRTILPVWATFPAPRPTPPRRSATDFSSSAQLRDRLFQLRDDSATDPCMSEEFVGLPLTESEVMGVWVNQLGPRRGCELYAQLDHPGGEDPAREELWAAIAEEEAEYGIYAVQQHALQPQTGPDMLQDRGPARMVPLDIPNL